MSKHKWKNSVEDENITTDNFTDEKANEILNENAETESVTSPDNEESEMSDNVADELTQLKDSYLRLMAEYDNYRKRTVKEKADLIKNGGERVLIGVLPIIDDFERAMKTLETATEIAAVKEGVSLIYSKFQTFLQQNGVKAIESNEQSFDPEMNEAIATIPATDEALKGKIIETVQTGYLLNDKVIRHAKVVVAN